MAETKTNKLGSVQGNLTAAYNARKKRDDLYKNGYAFSPDKAKRDEYAAVGDEMDKNYNTGFQEIRKLEEEIRNKPAFRSLTDADKERLQKIKDIKKQIPLQTRVAQSLLPRGLGRSSGIAPLQESELEKEINTVEEDTPTITVSKPKRKIEKLYRVMYAGKGADASEVYETKEEADAALRNSGGKGAVAGVNMSQKSRGEEMLPAEDVEKRKKEYIAQLSKTKEIPKKESDILQRINALRNPQTEEEILAVAENKGKMEEGIAKANEEKRVKDKAEGAKFADWRSGVDIRRRSEDSLNQFNNEMGMLKSAYRDAKQSGKPLEAIELSREIRKRQGSIPKEMGARKKYFEENAVRNRDAMLGEMKRIEQEREAVDRLASVNSDARDYIPRFNINNTAPIRLTY